MDLIDTSETYQMTNPGDHIDGTDVYQSNPNLLDNAYFVGGGSQLGGETFPINQRGHASYSANAYGIDRWICYGGAITLTADGLSVPANGVLTQPTGYRLTQLNGETLTLSVLYDSGIETGTAVLDLSGTTMFINNGAAGQTYITSGGLVQTYKGTASKIRAMKLELGTVSTLANDPPPDFGEELRKCQRYLFVLDIPAYLRLSSVAIASDTTNGAFSVVTPVNMAKSAIAASISGSLTIGGVGPVSSISWATAFGNNVYVAFVVNGAMVAGTMYPVGASAQVTKLILSAEL